MAVHNLDKSLSAAIAQLEKEFGKGAVMRLGDTAAFEEKTISTGCPSLDLALGIGGVPRGRIVEIYGNESSGKSSLALHVVAEAQKEGGVCAFIDSEHALGPEYAATIGVDVDNLLISQPSTGEEALQIADTLIRSGGISLVVIDSVAALVPRAEMEGEMGQSFMGLQARLMSQAMRKLTGSLSKSNTCAIFINQIREKVGVVYGNPDVTPGGRALKFYSSIRMELRKFDNLKDNDSEITGSRIRVKIVKNKMFPPFRKAELDLIHGIGFSKEASLLDVAVEKGIITKSGSWYAFEGENFAQGKDRAKEYFQENPDMIQKVKDALYGGGETVGSTDGSGPTTLAV